MPSAVEAGVAVNGTVDVARREMDPGSGMFVSKDGRWYAAMIPKTYQARNPQNMERWIDLPVLDDHQNLIMIPDPAAVKTIELTTKGKWEDGMPVMKSPDKKIDPVAEKLEKLAESIAESTAQQAKSNDTIAQLLAAVIARQK